MVGIKSASKSKGAYNDLRQGGTTSTHKDPPFLKSFVPSVPSTLGGGVRYRYPMQGPPNKPTQKYTAIGGGKYIAVMKMASPKIKNSICSQGHKWPRLKDLASELRSSMLIASTSLPRARVVESPVLWREAGVTALWAAVWTW